MAAHRVRVERTVRVVDRLLGQAAGFGGAVRGGRGHGAARRGAGHAGRDPAEALLVHAGVYWKGRREKGEILMNLILRIQNFIETLVLYAHSILLPRVVNTFFECFSKHSINYCLIKSAKIKTSMTH